MTMTSKLPALALAATVMAASGTALAAPASHHGAHSAPYSIDAYGTHESPASHSRYGDRYYYDDDDYDRRYRDSRRYRDQRRYYGEPVYRDTRVWRGRDGRVYCRRRDGTTGLIIGGAVGALLGREIDKYGDRSLGTILGAGAGALLGREVARGGSRCR